MKNGYADSWLVPAGTRYAVPFRIKYWFLHAAQESVPSMISSPLVLMTCRSITPLQAGQYTISGLSFMVFTLIGSLSLAENLHFGGRPIILQVYRPPIPLVLRQTNPMTRKAISTETGSNGDSGAADDSGPAGARVSPVPRMVTDPSVALI